MTAVTRGRILRGEAADGAHPFTLPAGTRAAATRRLGAVEAVSLRRARLLLAQARNDAERIVEDARRRADEVELEARARAQADALATVAATLARAAARERAVDTQALERSLALAELIAERLLKEALGLSPALRLQLAQTALEETAGARSVTLEVHPEDVEVLERGLTANGVGRSLTVMAAGDLSPGDLRIVTDIGTIDARLGSRIERLAQRLKESLRA